MESKKVAHLLHVPWTGLGLYGGFRGNRWLRNRITIFKHFVVPALLSQSNQDFILWCAWRYEEKNNPQVKQLEKWLKQRGFNVVFTYSGICFWDDKYEDKIAHERLVNSIHGSIGPLLNIIGEADEVLMTIQPSDDCYHSKMVEETQEFFRNNKDIHVFGYSCGYVMDYLNYRLAEWNPETTPPFYTIRFPRVTFADPFKHIEYTGPYKSHEYVKDFLPAKYVNERGFLVGTHTENISTIFNHPFAGHEFLGDNVDTVLYKFGLAGAPKLKLPFSFRKWLMRQLPHNWRRKIRYWFGERLSARIYNWLRA